MSSLVALMPTRARAWLLSCQVREHVELDLTEERVRARVCVREQVECDLAEQAELLALLFPQLLLAPAADHVRRKPSRPKLLDSCPLPHQARATSVSRPPPAARACCESAWPAQAATQNRGYAGPVPSDAAQATARPFAAPPRPFSPSSLPRLSHRAASAWFFARRTWSAPASPVAGRDRAISQILSLVAATSL